MADVLVELSDVHTGYALEIRGGHAAELGLKPTARLVLPLDLPK